MSTIHVLPNPSGITSEKYRTDAFGIAACKFIKTMPKFGYDIVHYGHEKSEVPCENVTIITNKEFQAPEDAGYMLYHEDDLNNIFCERVQPILASRVKPGDFVCSFYGTAHVNSVKGVTEKAFLVEPAIGYPTETVFSTYRGFVSYAWMHYYYGERKEVMTPSWYDIVIPNAFDPAEFYFEPNKQDYFVYLGRIITAKGIDLAIQITKHLGVRLLIAGVGKITENLGYSEVPDHVEEIGYVGQEQRLELLKNAKCLLAPTYYVEPFGNIVAEAGLSGTPVITTDWGGFTENVIHGVTGYRCRDFQQFIQAGKRILNNEINPFDCRKNAEEKYNLDTVHSQMHDWFTRIKNANFYHLDEHENK